MSEQHTANLYSAFRNHFPEDIEAPLIVTEQGAHYSYGYAEACAAKVANLLKEEGLVAGDRVSVQVEKSPEMLWLYLGVIRSGLVFHPLNTAYTPDELSYFLSDAEPAMVVCDPKDQGLFSTLCKNAKCLTLDSAGKGTLTDRLKAAPTTFQDFPTQPNDLACLLYSSGTTGRPKGIMLSHRNLIHNAQVLVKHWGFSNSDRLLHALPIFHVHGLFVAIGCALMSGSSMHWLSKFDTSQVINSMPSCTVMMGVPTYYTRLLADEGFSKSHVKDMRLFISGSAPLLAETFSDFHTTTGMPILERYGMTETGMNTSNPLEGERRPGTVGFPLPGTELRVVNEDGTLAQTGEIGNLQVKGKNVFQGYWKMPEKTAEDFTEDGFFITGDKAQIDKDGYVSIVGRAKDMIICGGLNVYPKEVELLIDQIPGIKESAVIGLPHADFGEVVGAVVVPEKGSPLAAEEIIEHLKPQIANFKMPKKVLFVDELPRNTMGKVQKNLLRKAYS